MSGFDFEVGFEFPKDQMKVAIKRDYKKALDRLGKSVGRELRSGSAEVPVDRGDLQAGFYTEVVEDGVEIFNREQHAGPVNYGANISNSRKSNPNRYFIQRFLARKLDRLVRKAWRV